MACTRTSGRGSSSATRRKSSSCVRGEPPLLLHEGAVDPRQTGVFREGVEHPQRGLGVVGGAVRVLERDAESGRDVAELLALLVLLQLARPDERVDPLDARAAWRSAAPRRTRPLARDLATRRTRLSKVALYAAGTAPSSALATSNAISAKVFWSFTSSSRMPWTSLASAGIGMPGFTSQFSRRITWPARPTTMPISTIRSRSGSRPVVSVSSIAMGRSIHAASGSRPGTVPRACTRSR